MAEQTPPQRTHVIHEITLKNLIEKIIEFWKELWNNKFLIILISIAFMVLFTIKVILYDNIYPATYTFMLNEESGNVLGSLSSTLSSFGLGGSLGTEYNPSKMLKLAKSRSIVSKVILTKTEINFKKDFLGNHFIEIYNFDNDYWQDDTTGLIGFRFSNNSLSSFSKSENHAIIKVYNFIVGDKNNDPVFNSDYDRESSIFSIGYRTINEELSIAATKIHLDSLSSFYIEQATEGPELTYNEIKKKQDSVYQLIITTENQLAYFRDKSRGLYTAKDKLREFQLQRDLEALYQIYKEVVKNAETSKFLLDTQTPVIRAIDEPLAPIEPEEESLLKNLIIGAFLGGFLAALFFIGRKIFRDAMAEG